MQRRKPTNKKPQGSRRTARGSKASSPNLGYAPVAMSMAVGSRPIPSVKSNGIVTRISHSEYFTSVESTGTGFLVSSYAVNPGVASCFPWLSQVAQRYETYKFREMCFHYHTRAATTQVGTVGLVFDFDAKDAAPTSQMVALSYHDKAADSCWKEIRLRLDLAQGDRLPTRYTRAGLPATPFDIKTLDLGNLHVFTDGVLASTNLGLLEVSYVVDLFTPQIENGVGGLLAGSAGMDATHVFGTTSTPDPQASLPFVVTSSSTITFDQAYEGLCGFAITGTVLSADLAVTISASGTASAVTQTVNVGATLVTGYFALRAVPGTTLSLALTATTVTSSITKWAKAAYVSIMT